MCLFFWSPLYTLRTPAQPEFPTQGRETKVLTHTIFHFAQKIKPTWPTTKLVCSDSPHYCKKEKM